MKLAPTRRAAILGLSCVGVIAYGVPALGPAPKPRPFVALEQALASELQSGWQLALAPDLPGPYRGGGSGLQTAPGFGGGWWYQNAHGKAGHKVVPKPGVEQLIVLLEVEGGRPTVAVLERRAKKPPG